MKEDEPDELLPTVYFDRLDYDVQDDDIDVQHDDDVDVPHDDAVQLVVTRPTRVMQPPDRFGDVVTHRFGQWEQASRRIFQSQKLTIRKVSNKRWLVQTETSGRMQQTRNTNLC